MNNQATDLKINHQWSLMSGGTATVTEIDWNCYKHMHL